MLQRDLCELNSSQIKFNSHPWEDMKLLLKGDHYKEIIYIMKPQTNVISVDVSPVSYSDSELFLLDFQKLACWELAVI